jgi:hypothetical protein
MATQIASRNRTNVRFQKRVGTKLESLAQISGEYFCASGAYEEGDFSRLFLIRRASDFCRDARTNRFGDCSSNALH